MGPTITSVQLVLNCFVVAQNLMHVKPGSALAAKEIIAGIVPLLSIVIFVAISSARGAFTTGVLVAPRIFAHPVSKMNLDVLTAIKL